MGNTMAEGLLSEVTALLGARLTVKAADQAYFGGKQVYTNVSNAASTSQEGGKGKESEHGGAVQQAIAKAKQIVDQALGGVPVSADSGHIVSEIESLKKENAAIRDELKSLREIIAKLEKVHLTASSSAPAPAAAAAPAKEESPAKEGDDDFDLFGSEDEEEDEEKKKLVEERLKAYAEKKSKKPGPIAKSSVILDVKPWDDETDLKEMEEKVRGIEMDGLVWGGAKQIAIGYGISKLQIICVIEDLKVSVDDLIDTITAFEDFVQSVDIVAFNKI